MPNEITHNAAPGLNLYAFRWQPDGNVFLTDGASDEAYGAGGNDADDYDVEMPETTPGVSGHYKGHFDAAGNIAASVQGYPVAVFLRAGGVPVDSDKPQAQGEIDWNGTSEIRPVPRGHVFRR